MAYKRKRAATPMRRKRTSRRRMYRRRRYGGASINRSLISYQREVGLGLLTIPAGTNTVFGAYAASLNSYIPNYSEFSNMFDQYRLKFVVWKFRLISPPEATSTAATQQYYPDIYVTVDHDDQGIPSSTDQILQYGKAKTGILKPNTWFTYKCYPTCVSNIYRGATSAYSIAPTKTWIDIAYTDVPFYGLKVALDASLAATQTNNWSCEVRAISKWEFKSSR